MFVGYIISHCQAQQTTKPLLLITKAFFFLQHYQNITTNILSYLHIYHASTNSSKIIQISPLSNHYSKLEHLCMSMYSQRTLLLPKLLLQD